MPKTTTHTNVPPYPRIGEIYRMLAVALNTKETKNHPEIDRLAREGEYDYSLLDELREKLFLVSLSNNVEPAFAKLIGRTIECAAQNYLALVQSVSLDALSRAEALRILTEHYFSDFGINLIQRIFEQFGGPDLFKLLDDDRHPITVIFDWVDDGGASNLAKIAFPNALDRDREMVSRWAQAAHLPKLSNIKLFSDALIRHDYPAEKAAHLCRWLLVARAIAYLEQAAAPMPIRKWMRQHLLRGLLPVDIGRILSMAVIDSTSVAKSLLQTPYFELREMLRRDTDKADGDQAKSKVQLEEYEQLAIKYDPENRAQFYLEWMKGRWDVLSGNYQAALPYYQTATELANYRAGSTQKHIIQEALVLAAHLKNKPFLKQLKHRATAFGLFAKPEEKDVIEDWEINLLHQQFDSVFPMEGRFKESDLTGDEESPSLFPYFLTGEFDKKQPDLRNPNRIFTIDYGKGQARRIPQLQFFVTHGHTDKAKAVLEAGASVDQLDKSNASALLRAIQYATTPLGAMIPERREMLNILLQKKHQFETLNSITPKKQLTPLLLAVDCGEPDVVERLLEMGETADLKGYFPLKTPLYHCLTLLEFVRNPNKFGQIVKDYQSRPHDVIEQESDRRNMSQISGGVWGC